MKNLNIKLVLIAMVLMFFTVTSAVAQVGIGTTNPDGSSMLDVNVDDLAVDAKKGVLIPRMNSTERADIPSPANGLLVFDTTSNSFWYYKTDTWKELVGSNSLVDADDDTKIEVEQNPDEDKIRFTAGGTEYMQIDTDGVIKLGNKGASTLTGGTKGGNESDTTLEENYTKITADGSLSYVGNATRWEDLKIPVNAVKKKEGDTDPATFDVFVDGLALLKFKNDKDRSVFFTVQMPHAWKEGSNIYPHVHWSSQADIADEGVIWGLEYRWATVGENFNDATTSPLTLVTGKTIATPNTPGGVTAYEHVITPLVIGATVEGGIDASGKTLSSMLICRFFRDVSDTSSENNVFLLEIDFHYQVDSDGSNQEYEKE